MFRDLVRSYQDTLNIGYCGLQKSHYIDKDELKWSR